MSKNFEQEYKNMLDAQIPDLWSRIEGQLHEKVQPVEEQSTVRSGVQTEVQSAGAVPIEMQPREVKKSAKRSRAFFATWGSAAAALVVLAIAIPVIFLRNADEEKAQNAFHAAQSTASADSAVPQMITTDEAATEDRGESFWEAPAEMAEGVKEAESAELNYETEAAESCEAEEVWLDDMINTVTTEEAAEAPAEEMVEADLYEFMLDAHVCTYVAQEMADRMAAGEIAEDAMFARELKKPAEIHEAQEVMEQMKDSGDYPEILRQVEDKSYYCFYIIREDKYYAIYFDAEAFRFEEAKLLAFRAEYKE